jgi:hypothetical protein
MFDYGYLIVIAIALMVTWWPIGTWHLWSFMWLAIMIIVLAFEAFSRFISPDKETISDVMRAYRKKHPVMFWAVQIPIWLLFGLALSLHLAVS